MCGANLGLPNFWEHQNGRTMLSSTFKYCFLGFIAQYGEIWKCTDHSKQESHALKAHQAAAFHEHASQFPLYRAIPQTFAHYIRHLLSCMFNCRRWEDTCRSARGSSRLIFLIPVPRKSLFLRVDLPKAPSTVRSVSSALVGYTGQTSERTSLKNDKILEHLEQLPILRVGIFYQ